MGAAVSGCGHFSFSDDDPDCQALGFGAAALRYAACGFAVLPLEPGAKRPHRMLGRDEAGLGGVYRASTDPAIIRAWWANDPAANVGIATGARNGLAVLDLDVKNGQNGIAAWGGYLASHPELPWPGGPWAVTPSGGAHIWLAASGPVRDRSSRAALAPGVDVRGDGGLVVAPPSVALRGAAFLCAPGEHPSAAMVPMVAGSYGWKGCPLCWLPVAPAWLLAALEQWPAAGAGGGSGDGSGAGGPGDELPELEVIVAAGGFAPGERNDSLYRLACRCWRRYPGRCKDPLGAVREAWMAGDRAGLGWGEVLTICASARRFVEAQEAAELEIRRGRLGDLFGGPRKV